MSESPTAEKQPERFRAPALVVPASLPLAMFIAALLLAYGFQVFSFNLTIDEEAYADVARVTRAGWSLGLGRWGMAALTLISPVQVAPVVAAALAVGLSGAAWWLISRRVLAMTALQSVIAAAVAGTIPVLAFIYSFDTISFGIGVGNILLLVFAVGIQSPSWLHRALAVGAATFAVGIYDSFIAAIAVLALATVIRAPRLRTAAVSVGAAVAALVLSRLIGFVVSLVVSVPSSGYTEGFFDVGGFLAAPIPRLIGAVRDVWSTLFLSADLFGLSSPWLGIVVVLLVVAAVIAVIVTPATRGERLLRILALVGILVLPVVIEAISWLLPLRSMIYLPIIVLVLASVAFGQAERLRAKPRRVLMLLLVGLSLLAVVGNATVTNRLYAISDTAYAMDRQLAFEIGQQKDMLLDGVQSESVPLMVNGLHAWPAGAFTEVHETFGLSFFALNQDRTIQFLKAHGVVVTEPTAREQKAATAEFASMPAYPMDGWVAVENGVLLVNFGTGE